MSSAFDVPQRASGAHVTKSERDRPPLLVPVAGCQRRGEKYSAILADNMFRATTLRDADHDRILRYATTRGEALEAALEDTFRSVHRLEQAKMLRPWSRAAEDFAHEYLRDFTGEDYGVVWKTVRRLSDLWSVSSPLQVESGSYIQSGLQGAHGAAVPVTAEQVALSVIREATRALLDAVEVTELTVYRTLRWRHDPAVPMARKVPEWMPETGYVSDDDQWYTIDGADFPVGTVGQISPLAGYTLSPVVARLLSRRKTAGGVPPYGYAILEATVPAEMVMALPLTGMGSLAMHEVILDVPEAAYTGSVGLHRSHLVRHNSDDF